MSITGIRHISPGISRTAPRSIVVPTVLLCLLLLLGSDAAAQSISVTGQNDQEFGSLFRSSTVMVGYSANGAAQFRVVGRKNRGVRLTITRQNLSGSNQSIPLSISNSNCAYSLDGGTTWYAFSTGTLYHDTEFPTGEGGGNTSTIYVRVGGSITSGSQQHRGTYTGSVTLSAEYLDDGNSGGGND